LKFLADENFPLPVIHSLIEAGYDDLSFAKVSPGINDHSVLPLLAKRGAVCLLLMWILAIWFFLMEWNHRQLFCISACIPSEQKNY